MEALVAGLRGAHSVRLADANTRAGPTPARRLSDKAVDQLAAVGITSVSQLAAADTGRLAAGVGVDVKTASEWVEAARQYQETVIDDRQRVSDDEL